MANNLTLGRGELHFARYKSGTQNPDGERYLGNSSEFNATIEVETLDHFDSDHGINEKDESITLQTNRTGSFITDNIDPENVALFFFGSKSALTVAGQTIPGEVIADVIPGLTYQLGTSAAHPSGLRNLALTPAPVVSVSGVVAAAASGTITFTGAGAEGDTIAIGDTVYTLRAAPAAAYDVDIGGTATATAANLAAAIVAGAGAGTAYGTGTLAHEDVSAAAATAVVTVTSLVPGVAGNQIGLVATTAPVTLSGANLAGGAGGPLTEGVDYTIDLILARVTVLSGGAVQAGDDLNVSYTTATHTRTRVISGTNPISGSLRYIAFNPVGENFDWFMPYVKLSPNGDYALKGDEWQQIPFNVEILKKSGYEALYIDGRPYTPTP